MNAPARFTRTVLTLTALVVGLSTDLFAPRVAAAATRTPVILDADIGDDIDDTWALGLLLKSPELDLKLVVGDHGKTLYRARLFAKFLQAAGRADVPIGLGADVNRQGDGPQADWVKDYDLNAYPGRIHPDGVRALVHLIMNSPEPITLIAIGPLPNIAAALRLEPRIASKARFVGMHGSVRVGYGGSKDVHAEYNVKEDAKACQQVFAAPWIAPTITPLDTCSLVDLRDAHYRQMLQSKDPVAQAIIENYRTWAEHGSAEQRAAFPTRSSILFDTVAVYLAMQESFTTMETLPLKVTDDGFTRIDPAGQPFRVATAWKDKPGFESFLVQRLTGR